MVTRTSRAAAAVTMDTRESRTPLADGVRHTPATDNWELATDITPLPALFSNTIRFALFPHLSIPYRANSASKVARSWGLTPRPFSPQQETTADLEVHTLCATALCWSAGLGVSR